MLARIGIGAAVTVTLITMVTVITGLGALFAISAVEALYDEEQFPEYDFPDELND